MKAAFLISSSMLGLIVAAPAAAQTATPDAEAGPKTTQELSPVARQDAVRSPQAAEQTPTAGQQSAVDGPGGDIIVTATRRNERLQDVPLSVTAFDQAELTKRGIVGFEGLARDTPGIVLNKQSANFNNFTARGIATNSYGANLQSSVAVYIDELPISVTGNATLIDPSLFDVERVEFLRGPQGTLFGSGSLSGALRILNRNPDLEKVDGAFLLDFAQTQSDSFRSRANAMVNIPLVNGKLGLRVVGFYRYEEGYLDNVGTGLHNANTLRDGGGRAILLWKPNDRLSARFLFSHEDSTPEDSSLTQPSLGRNKRNSFRPDLFTAKLTNYNATIEYQFDGAKLSSSSTYSSYNQQFGADISATLGGAVPLSVEATGRQRTFVEEARLISDSGGKWDWIIGGFYLNRELRATTFLRTSPAFLIARNISGARGPAGDAFQENAFRTKSHELAGFGELTYHFSDKLWATGGIRYGRTDSQTSYVPGGFSAPTFLLQALFGIPGQLAIIPTPVSSTPEVRGTRPSFKGSVSFKPTTSLTTYATVSTGFRAPIYNANAGLLSPINPNDLAIPTGASSDNLINYEIGLKGRFLDGKLLTNLAAYYIDWDNIQVQGNRVSDAAQFTSNIGHAVSKGIEFEIVAKPIAALTLGASGSYNDAKVTQLSASEAAISGAVKGARLTSPHFQGSAYAQLNFKLAGAPGFFNATIQHVGSYPNSFPFTAGRPGVPNPGYGFTNAYENVNLSLGAMFGSLSATIYAENLLDDHSVTYLHPEAILSSRVGTLRPRTVGIRLGYTL